MQKEHSRKPILVTGSIRSGTTWVGRMISLAPSVAYIHEPFNPGRRPGLCGAPIEKWFTYVCKDSQDDMTYRTGEWALQ